MFFKRFCLLGTVSILLAACGGGDDSSGGGGGIVGSWASPCTTHTPVLPAGPTVYYKITLTFNADNSMKFRQDYYQEESCINLETSGLINREFLGGYQIGAETTAHDGIAADELDLYYNVSFENDSVLDENFDKAVLSVYRISGNELISGNIHPVDSIPDERSIFIYSSYPYTHQ